MDQPTLLLHRAEDGRVVVCSPWFPFIRIGEAFLGADFLHQSDGELIFDVANGGARYALGPVQPDGTRLARLLASW